MDSYMRVHTPIGKCVLNVCDVIHGISIDIEDTHGTRRNEYTNIIIIIWQQQQCKQTSSFRLECGVYPSAYTNITTHNTT